LFLGFGQPFDLCNRFHTIAGGTLPAIVFLFRTIHERSLWALPVTATAARVSLAGLSSCRVAKRRRGQAVDGSRRNIMADRINS
jgi:hypothetical protein